MHKRSYRLARPGAPSLSIHEWSSGEPVLLAIHGFGDGAFVWNGFMPRLAPFGRVVAVDLRGHGDSDWGTSMEYGPTTHLEDMIHVIEALTLNNVILIGHSLGGEIALRIAIARSERIAGLVIVDYGPELNGVATSHIRREFVAESRSYSSHAEYAAHLQAKLPLIDPGLSNSLAKDALRLDRRGGYVLKRDPAMCDSEPTDASSRSTLWSALPQIRCPVLLIRGVASSVLSHSVAQRMVKALPNASLVSIRLAGHSVMTDNPEAFTAATTAFLAEHAPPAPTTPGTATTDQIEAWR
jgi:pimeloyl-ACP methyl ester carboxylesterase